MAHLLAYIIDKNHAQTTSDYLDSIYLDGSDNIRLISELNKAGKDSNLQTILFHF